MATQEMVDRVVGRRREGEGFCYVSRVSEFTCQGRKGMVEHLRTSHPDTWASLGGEQAGLAKLVSGAAFLEEKEEKPAKEQNGVAHKANGVTKEKNEVEEVEEVEAIDEEVIEVTKDNEEAVEKIEVDTTEETEQKETPKDSTEETEQKETPKDEGEEKQMDEKEVDALLTLTPEEVSKDDVTEEDM